MTEHQPGTVRSFLKHTFAILALATSRNINRISQRNWPSAGMRLATRHKDDGAKLLATLLGILFLGISFTTSYQAVHGLANHATAQHPMSGAEHMVVDFIERSILKSHAQAISQYQQEKSTSADHQDTPAGITESSIRELTNYRLNLWNTNAETARARSEKLVSHLEAHGMAGFVEKHPSPYHQADFQALSPGAESWLGSAYAIVFCCLFTGLTLMPMSTRSKDLASLDSHLAWLYCLPLTSREILSGRFLSMTFVRPMSWLMLFPVTSTLLWAMGYGPAGLLAGLCATIACSVASTGIELAAETWLRCSASFRMKKNVQAAASIIGTLSLFTGMAACFAGTRSTDWLDWLVTHIPERMTAGIGGLIMLPLQGNDGLIRLGTVALILAATCGAGGWLVAARALDHGLTSGNEREGNRTPQAGLTRNRSLAGFEWLLLMRDRNLATTVLVMPPLLIGFQVLINPGMVAGIDARNLAVIGFGCGVWAASMTSPHVIASETRSMWIVFSLPVEIAGYFEKRTRVWRAAGVIIAAAVMLAVAVWKGGIPTQDWWRIPAAIAGIWVASLVVYSIMMGNATLPDPTEPEQPKIGIMRTYACLLFAGLFGTLIWKGDPWQVFSGSVLCWFFGFSLWQGVVRKLRYLLEPTMSARPGLTLSNALTALVVFFFVMVVTSGLNLLVSYTIAGITAAIYCAASLSNHSLPEIPRNGIRLRTALPLATVACIACGAAWLAVLGHVSPFREIHQASIENGSIIADLRKWHLVILAVAAAPLVEEFLFRGYVLRIMLHTWPRNTAVFASALLFAILHPGLSFPPVFVLGLATAWLYSRSQRLWPGILLHAAYNGAIVAISHT